MHTVCVCFYQISVKNRDRVNKAVFLKLGRIALQAVLDEYKSKPKFGDDHGDKDNEISAKLNEELNLYAIKHSNYMNMQRIECEKLATLKWKLHEKKLEKIFSAGCFLPEEVSEKFQTFVDKNPVACPRGIKSGQFAESFKRLVKKAQESTKIKLLGTNEEKLRSLRVTLNKRSQDCVSYARIKMDEKIRQQIWNNDEIADVKNEIFQFANEKWQSLVDDVNGPETICNEYKISIQANVQKMIEGFETKNQQRKNDAEQQANLEVEKLKKLYMTKMTEKMCNIWRKDIELRSFRYDAQREIRIDFLKKPLSQYLIDLTLWKWSNESYCRLDAIKKMNERFLQRDDELCLEVVKKCKNEASSLITKELGIMYHEEDELEGKKLAVKRMIWTTFDSDKPDCAACTIVKKHKTILEKYLETDFDNLIMMTNERNKEFALHDIADIKLYMKSECGALFAKMLSGKMRTLGRLPYVCDMVRESLEEIVERKASCSFVKNRCMDMIGQIVRTEEEKISFNMKMEEEKLLNKQRELKTKCVCKYRKMMDEFLESGRETMYAHRTAYMAVSAEFRFATNRADIMKKLEEEKKEYEETERLKRKKSEEHRRRIVLHFKNFMEAKLGSYSCSERRFKEIKNQAIEDAEFFRKKLNADARESILDVLSLEFIQFEKMFEDRNNKFQEECTTKMSRISKEFQEHVDENFLRYSKNTDLLHDVAERYENQFPKDLNGNPDIITERTSALREMLLEFREKKIREFEKRGTGARRRNYPSKDMRYLR